MGTSNGTTPTDTPAAAAESFQTPGPAEHLGPQVDLRMVVDNLAGRVATLSRELAIKDAYIAQLESALASVAGAATSPTSPTSPTSTSPTAPSPGP